jgi:nucleoside-diphosphate-sugar epimerase
MISVYGASGFIGNKYCEKFGGYRMGRDEIIPPIETTKIVYFISTVDNYNILSNPFLDIQTNLIHLINVLEECKGKNIEFVFISSWFVYGDTELPANENSCCNPKGFYSITKRTAEQLLESYCNTFGLKYKIIRLSNVIGDDDRKTSKKKNVLQYLIGEIKSGNSISLYNGGDFYRDFIDVHDVVEGINFISEHEMNGEIYNLGSGTSKTLKEIINYVFTKLETSVEILPMELNLVQREVHINSFIMDVRKLKKLGFIPKYSIFESIDKILQL